MSFHCCSDLDVTVVFPILSYRNIRNFLELTSSAYPKRRWSARRALRSRGDTGCFERGLVSRRAREAEKRDGEVRFSVRPCLPELELSALSFILHPPSVPLEYRGMIARHIESRYFIATTTRHSLTLPPGTSRSSCPRSLKPAEDKDRASRSRRGASLCSSTGITNFVLAFLVRYRGDGSRWFGSKLCPDVRRGAPS